MKQLKQISLLTFALFFIGTVCISQTIPSVSRFELVATDANNILAAATYGNGTVTIANSWGNHQPRITKTNDGTIYLLYLNLDNSGKNQWRLMKRSTAGVWSEVAKGSSAADAYLMHNIVTDELTVIAWPNGPSYWTSPSYVQKSIPGSWLTTATLGGNHYAGCGIGPDGTICLKEDMEFPDSPQNPATSITHIHYICGKSNGTSIVWGNYINVDSVGIRYAYDYLFPSTQTPLGIGVLATSQRDTYKTAEPMPNSSDDYIFNGGKMWWSIPTASSPTITSTNIIAPISAPTVTNPPTQRIDDSYLDNTGRLFTTYFVDNPAATATNGIYLTVANSSIGGAASTFFRGKLAVPTYGYCRVYQDASDKLWILWTNEGSQQTQVSLFPLIQTGTGNTATFSLGTNYDLSSSFAPYVIVKYPYLAVPRSGAVKDYSIDGIMSACTNSYPSSGSWASGNCYNSDDSGKEQVFYFRISLPNLTTSINNEAQQTVHTLNVYPNPSNSFIEIHTDLSTVKELEIKIYDVLGKEVATKKITPYDNRLETSDFLNGIYFIKGQKENNVFIQKFSVQH